MELKATNFFNQTIYLQREKKRVKAFYELLDQI